MSFQNRKTHYNARETSETYKIGFLNLRLLYLRFCSEQSAILKYNRLYLYYFA